jgi:hypothetical protein
MIYKLIALSIYLGIYLAWGLPGCIAGVVVLLGFHVGYRLTTGKWMEPV